MEDSNGSAFPYKTIPEALKECVNCAREGSDTRRGRVVLFLKAMPRELLTQTSLWSRGAILVLLLLLVVSTTALAVFTARLAGELQRQNEEFQIIVEQTEENTRNDIFRVF